MNPDQNTEDRYTGHREAVETWQQRRNDAPVKLIELPRDQLITLIQEAALVDKYREDLIFATKGLRDAALEAERYRDQNQNLIAELELTRERGEKKEVKVKRKYRRRRRTRRA